MTCFRSSGAGHEYGQPLEFPLAPTSRPMMEKCYITANDLLNDAFELGFRILDSGFRPDLLLAVWRGGTPVAVAVQELLEQQGVEHRHFVIRTSHYRGIDDRHSDVAVEGLDHALATTENTSRPISSILIVDDVYDTGLSMAAIIAGLERHFAHHHPERTQPAIRVATPYFKPAQNRTGRTPDYFLHSTDQWIVFPHELQGLDSDEIAAKGVPALTRRRERSKREN